MRFLGANLSSFEENSNCVWRKAILHGALRAALLGSTAAFFGVGAVAPDAALAQTSAPPQFTPPTRDQLTPPEQRRDERSTTLTIDGDLERTPCALDRAEYSDITLTLTGVEFGGLDAVPGLSLAEASEGYFGRELPLAVLCDIRAKANAILREQGYLATVEIPEQNLSDGVADFGVVFGRLTGLRVRGDAGPSERVVASYLEQLTDQPVFNTKDAERYLLLADDLPGVDVRLSLRPAAGGAPGDLQGEIAVVRRRGMVDVNIQNFASRSVGRFGGLLQGEVYDITGMGDRTSVSVYSTLEFIEQQTFQLGHDFAVGSQGLRLGGQFTFSQSSPDINLANVNLESETVLATVFASYPLKRSRSSNIYLDGGFDLVDQDVTFNDIALSRDRVRTVFLRASGDWTDKASIQRFGGYSPYEPKLRTRWAAELRKGLDVFSLSPDCRSTPAACFGAGIVPPSRVEADPDPLVLRTSFGVDYRPDPLLTFSLDSMMQFSDDPLPSFEEFAAGSFSIGRGYDPGVVLGDSGIGVTLETRYGSLAPEGPEQVAYQPYVFTDVAWAWNEDPSRSASNPDRLWSAGMGLRAVLGSAIQADAFIAVPLERPDLRPDRGDVRFMFNVTAKLFPWSY